MDTEVAFFTQQIPLTKPPVIKHHHGPLSYQMLEELYQDICYGSAEPTRLYAGPVTLTRVTDLIWALAKPEYRPRSPTGIEYFNLARISMSTMLPEGVIKFVGGKAEGWLILGPW
jgi:hypothetical protein